MRLLSILMAALGSLVYAQTPVSEQSQSVRLSMAGWTEAKPDRGMRIWRDADGDLLSLAVPDPAVPLLDSSTVAEVRRWARAFAQRRGAGLIEVAVVAPLPHSIVSLIYKRLQRDAYVYTGMLVMSGHGSSLVWTVVAGECGTTGVREATITVEMMKSGELTIESYQRLWAQDPYDPTYHGVDTSVLRSLSDDQRYDERFPHHPLSKVRRVLAALPTSVAMQP